MHAYTQTHPQIKKGQNNKIRSYTGLLKVIQWCSCSDILRKGRSSEMHAKCGNTFAKALCIVVAHQ